MNLEDKTIAVIGLGYVGLPLAVEFGKKRPVIGFDIKSARIEELRAGRDRTLEVEAEELAAARHLMFSAQEEDLRQCGIFIVTVPTPIDNAKRPDLTALFKASETVGRVMPPGAVVIYESTVYPGATEEVCVPILEREWILSGRSNPLTRMFMYMTPGSTPTMRWTSTVCLPVPTRRHLASTTQKSWRWHTGSFWIGGRSAFAPSESRSMCSTT